MLVDLSIFSPIQFNLIFTYKLIDIFILQEFFYILNPIFFLFLNKILSASYVLTEIHNKKIKPL
jgi:hypothetical protein